MIMSARALAWFLGSLLVVSWTIQSAALYLVGDANADAMEPWLLCMMFVPALWAVAYLAIFNRSAWKLIRFWPGNPIYLVLAALIPAAIGFGVLVIAEQQGWAVSSFFRFNAGGVNVLRGPWVMGDGAQDWGFFAANVAATAVLFAFLNGVVAVGEEFCWRGVLQHHMIERLGLLRGVALLGFVWAIWHAPVNLAGYNYPDTPVLGALVLAPIELIAMSFIMACVTLRARSFWPAVLLHGSGNGIEEGIMSSLTLGAGIAPLTAEIVQLGLTLTAAIMCVLLTLRQRHTLAPEASSRHRDSLNSQSTAT
jgi:uncharacterized protein